MYRQKIIDDPTNNPPPPHLDPLRSWTLLGAVSQTVGLDADIRFDYSGNGFQEASGWVGPGSGLLMIDREQ